LSNQWGLTVELRPHIGIADTPLGPSEVEYPQWIVMVASRAIEENYGVPAVECGRAGFDSQTVEFDAHTNKWPAGAKDWICQEVARLTATKRRKNSPVMPAAPQTVDLDEEQDGIEEVPDEIEVPDEVPDEIEETED